MTTLRHEHSFLFRVLGIDPPKLVAPVFWMAILCTASFLSAAAPPLYNFGSVSVNATPATYAFTASINGVTSAPSWHITGAAFSQTAMSCSLSAGTAACTGTIAFAPAFPGLQTGALYAETTSGTLLATWFFRGVGLSSQLVLPPANISTYAGTGAWGFANGTLAHSVFANPSGIAMDQSGNLYVADSVNQVVRKITSSAVTTVAGTGAPGYAGDNGPATSATLNNPSSLALDPANNLYIADQGNGLIRRVDAISGIITTVAGGGGVIVTASASSLSARSASLSGPQCVIADPAGNLFISDSFHQIIVRVDAVTNYITLYAGGGTGGGSDGLGDGLAATSAILNNPTGLAIDASGNLYLSDTGNSMVRVVSASTGIIEAVAGSGNYGYSGDSGPALNAAFKEPMGLRIDSAGDLYIADSGNNVIRQTHAATGTITTLAGSGISGYSGDNASALNAKLNNPTDLVLSLSGALFIADNGNNVVRQVTASTPAALAFPTTIVGDASSNQTVTVFNRGNQPLTFSSITTGANFPQISGVSPCTTATPLPSGATCYITLQFSPTTSGSASSSLALADNSLNLAASQAFALSGIGVAGNAPHVSLNTSALTFPGIPVGSSQNQSITLTNSGAAPLGISGIVISGSAGAYAASTTCGTSLAATDSCTITVTFAPVSGIAYPATLTITDSAGNSPQQVTLSGTGNGGAMASLNVSALSFNSFVNIPSPSQAVVLTNIGTATLTLGGITLTGVNTTDFTVSSTCGATLTAGQSCATSLVFTPGALGARSATLTFTDGSGDSSQQVTLSGTAVTLSLPSQSPATFTPGAFALAQGSYITLGPLELVMQSDGNLVLYQNWATPLWSTGTGGHNCGSNQCYVYYQPNGNLTVYDGSTALWSSGSSGSASLTFSSQWPYLQIANSSGTVAWSDSISAGNFSLPQGAYITLGSLELVMQGDGNLVLYRNWASVLWSTGTGGHNCGSNQCYLYFQPDGNFVVYDGSTPLWYSASNGSTSLTFSAQWPYLQIANSAGTVVWSDPITAGNFFLTQGAYVTLGSIELVMQGDGNLVLYRNWASVLWDTASGGHNCGSNQCYVYFQYDGNFVVYDGSAVLWYSNTAIGPAATLTLSESPPYISIR